MLYRIYTEDMNRSKIEQLANDHFEGYSIINSTGYWRGVREASLIIEVWTDDDLEIEALAEDIKEANDQDAVLVMAIEAEGRLIGEEM